MEGNKTEFELGMETDNRLCRDLVKRHFTNSMSTIMSDMTDGLV